MLLLVFCIATLNLAVGYALGAGLTVSDVLERLPLRRGKSLPVDIEDDEPLSRPAKPEKPAESPKAEEPTADEPAPAKKPEPETNTPTSQEVLASLAQFRENLATANTELKQNTEDADEFTNSASKLQEANHAYLEHAEGAIKQLETLGAAGDARANGACEAVSEGASEVAAISEEIDGIIETGIDDEAARSKLIEKSEAIEAASAKAQKASDDAVAMSAAESDAGDDSTTSESEGKVEAEESVSDDDAKGSTSEAAEESAEESGKPALFFASMDELFDQLKKHFAEADGEVTQQLAAFRVDPVEGAEENDELLESIEQSIEQVAREMMGESHTFVRGQPAVLLLEGDSFEAAAGRVEKLRQQIEKTTFAHGSDEFKVTVTCAVADAHDGDEQDAILDQIHQALEESERLGKNRTYHHDGAFPTPLPEGEVNVELRRVEV